MMYCKPIFCVFSFSHAKNLRFCPTMIDIIGFKVKKVHHESELAVQSMHEKHALTKMESSA